MAEKLSVYRTSRMKGALRYSLLRLGGVSLLIVAAPGAKLFLPAIPAKQAGLLAHILAEDAP